MPERCDCHGFLVEDCNRLRGVEVKETAEKAAEAARIERLHKMRHTFPARYPGKCARCEEHFAEGAPLKAIADGAYIGPCCIDEAS